MDYANWYDSVDKWGKICDNVKARRGFISSRGFYDVLVVSGCGYCREFQAPDYSCNSCPLMKDGFCHENGDSLLGQRSVFWRFVWVMQSLSDVGFEARYRMYRRSRLWKMANQLSFQMLERIRKDDPRRAKPTA